MQSSIQQLQDQARKLQGLELHQDSHIILHGLHNREDLNGMVGTVGDFDDGKARWAIKTRKGESIWVKDANLLPANSMEAKAIFMANYEETRVKIEASEQRLQQVDEEVKKIEAQIHRLHRLYEQGTTESTPGGDPRPVPERFVAEVQQCRRHIRNFVELELDRAVTRLHTQPDWAAQGRW